MDLVWKTLHSYAALRLGAKVPGWSLTREIYVIPTVVSHRLSPLGGTIEVSLAKSLTTGSSGLTASLLSVCYVLGKQYMKVYDAGEI